MFLAFCLKKVYQKLVNNLETYELCLCHYGSQIQVQICQYWKMPCQTIKYNSKRKEKKQSKKMIQKEKKRERKEKR